MRVNVYLDGTGRHDEASLSWVSAAQNGDPMKCTLRKWFSVSSRGLLASGNGRDGLPTHTTRVLEPGKDSVKPFRRYMHGNQPSNDALSVSVPT